MAVCEFFGKITELVQESKHQYHKNQFRWKKLHWKDFFPLDAVVTKNSYKSVS